MSEHISERMTDDDGRTYVMIGEKKVYQMEEHNPSDRKANDSLNAYRASGHKGGMQAYLKELYGYGGHS